MTAEPANNLNQAAERLHSRQVDLILDQLESLPTLPEVATQLLNLTASSSSDAQQVISLIKADQTLTARILSLAARADSGLRKEARTIGKAVLMLGFETVRSTVMSIKVFEMFGPTDTPVMGLDRREFWKHCIAVACCSELLATHLRLETDPEEAFVCGLLHDIGKLALEQCLPKSYTRIIETCNSQYGNIAEYERQIIGVDHTIAGRRLAQQWRLPSVVENTIWLHHQPVEAIPESVEGRKTVGIIHLADTIAREQRFGYSGNFTFPADSIRLATQLGVNASALAGTLDQLPGMIEQRAQTMGMGETTSESLFRSALGNANQELGRINQKFSRRASQAVSQAKGLKLLTAFSAELSASGSLSQLAELIAKTWAQTTGLTTGEHTAVGAYILSRSDNIAILACGGDAKTPPITLIPTRADLQSIAAPGAGVPAAVAITQFAAKANIPPWIARPTMTHRPLICGGQWVGGLLWPAGEADDGLGAETIEAIAGSMAVAAAMVETRDHGNTMTEQLAQSSQQLYATQESLTDARTMAAVGEMAAGAAHEINNPLAVIAGRAQLMAESADEADRQTWTTVASQAQRISDIVSELMEFAKPPEPKRRVVDAESLIAAAEQIIRQDPKTADLAVSFDVAADTPNLWVDPEQIACVLAELMTNARAAQDADPQVRIEVQTDPVAGRVLIRVIDHGRGMEPETLEKAFTPFYSDQPAGRNRGMGLPRARRYVQLAGGKIWINSVPSEGATVCVMLPPAEDSAEQPPGEVL